MTDSNPPASDDTPNEGAPNQGTPDEVAPAGAPWVDRLHTETPRAADMPEPRLTMPPPPMAATPAVHPPATRSRSALPVLCALGFLLLLAGLGWLWNEQREMVQRLSQAELHLAEPPPSATPPADTGRLADFESRLKALDQRVADQVMAQRKLETASASVTPPPTPPAAPDLGPLEARIAALENRKPAPAPDPAAATAPLAARLDSMAAETAPLTARLDSVAAEAAPLTARLDSLTADLATAKADLTAAKSDLAATKSASAAQVAGLAARLQAAEQKQALLADRAGQVEQQQSALTDRAAQLQHVAAAGAALQAGQPLGDLPGAPPALARFATANPPTEAQLRLSFASAAAAATEASRPSVEGKSLGERMWLHARSLVMVKQGDNVLVGAPAATVLGNAQERLDAGDLAGAVAALKGLDPAATHAMAGWIAQAQALLDARSALAQLARS